MEHSVKRRLPCEDIMYYIYIVKCTNGNLYTGITTNVARRFAEHQSKGKISAKYTRANPAVSLEAVWSTGTRGLASKLEYFIKSLNRKSKLELISNPENLIKTSSNRIEPDDYNFEKDLISFINQKK